LPDVSELTAESDISAFLRKGVPEAVRQAALRRVWALDPGIRNFVSPAEYAWDFNNPNSIPGFSSSVTSMDLTGFFSGERSTEPLQTGLTPVEEGRTPADIEAPLLENAAPAVRRESAPTASPQEEGRSFVIVEQPAEEVSDTSPRRHGGALPR
jgi:hypothetical protein